MRANAHNIIKGDYTLLNNPSKKYTNGSIWPTKNYGNITIIGFIGRKVGKTFFVVEFEDGTRVIADQSNIKNGMVKNPYKYGSVCGVGCLGCQNSHHFLYAHWNQMLHRCYDKSHIRYKDYGGRGIKVCQRWLCFEYFVEDISKIDDYELLKNGRKFQLDRIDNNGNYEPENCRIVSASTNNKNKRDSVIAKVIIDNQIDFIGCLIDISNKYNVQYWKVKDMAKDNREYNGIKIIKLNELELSNYEKDMARVRRNKT